MQFRHFPLKTGGRRAERPLPVEHLVFTEDEPTFFFRGPEAAVEKEDVRDVNDRISGHEIRAIRARLGMSEVQFALLFGVTVRTIQLWESEVVVPSVLTSMVIRAEAGKRLAAGSQPAIAPRTKQSRTQRQVAAPRVAARRSRQRA